MDDVRRFQLRRLEDLSGVSGIGIVAEGVEFGNGKVALCWTSKYDIDSIIANMHTLLAVHGHGGRTVVEWIDPEEDK